MAVTGNGTTVAWETTSFSTAPLYRSIEGIEQTLGVLDNSDLSTTTYMSKLPADLQDFGDITLNCYVNMTEISTVEAAIGTVQTLTLTLPEDNAAGNAPSILYDGFISGYSIPTIANNEIVDAVITFTPNGLTVTWTDDAAA